MSLFDVTEPARTAVAYVEGGSLSSDNPGWNERHNAGLTKEQEVQASLLRDIFGPLMHREVRIALSILKWNDGTVVKLAQAIYEDRRLPEGTFDNGHLAILADALEEASCTDAELLAHLRSPGPHVRGCFALDSVLNKS
jgi:hypothetical protein